MHLIHHVCMYIYIYICQLTDDEAMAGCMMTTLRLHDLVIRPFHVGPPALRAVAGCGATEWRAISLGFKSVWRYRDSSNYGLGWKFCMQYCSHFGA